MLSNGEAVVEVEAYLGAYDDVVTLIAEGLAQQRLAVALAVGVSGIEVVDSQLERGNEQVDGVVLRDDRPCLGAQGPEAEADFGEE